MIALFAADRPEARRAPLRSSRLSIVWADVSTFITIRVFDDLDTLEAANAAASAASAQIVADFAVAPSEPSEGEVILFDSI